MKWIFWVILFVGTTLPSFKPSLSFSPKPALAIAESREKFHKEYLKFLDDFNSRHCSRAVKNEFDQLVHARNELTAYVPETLSGELDIATIQKGQEVLDKKWTWLIDTRQRLKKIRKWPQRDQLLGSMRTQIRQLLDLKEERFLKGDTSKSLEDQSKKLLGELRREFESVIQQVFFLQGFGYPVDHLAERLSYEELKVSKSASGIQKANYTMFLRKQHEDGTFNSRQGNSDVYLRTTLNTLSINLRKEDVWLSEEVRHDLEWAIRRIGQMLSYGKSEQVQRIQNWINKVANARRFYKNILTGNRGQKEIEQFIDKQEAGRKLKEFVYKKNALVYKDLLNQSEKIRAYYVFDQILLHEVGAARVDNFRDRQDIAQVVINSRFHPRLSHIEKSEDLYSYLVKAGVDEENMATGSWLNTLFKGLRFSFTLYYIPAVKHIFCPDFFKVARTTRSKNLFLIWDALKMPSSDFKALRYFSRWSMTGRIDMSQVWTDFKQIPERPGAQYKNDLSLEKDFSNKKYRYLYSFTDPEMRTYHVLEIRGKIYVVEKGPKGLDFFAYRDPHRFRFFEPIRP